MTRHDDTPEVRTDFAHYSHAELVRMLYASDPATVRAVAATWSAAGTALHERSADLRQQLLSFQDKWTGGAADQYKSMIKDLAAGIDEVATTVLEVRNLTDAAADALRTAREQMPAAVAVPVVSSATLSLASTPLPAVAPPGDSLAAMAARQANARAAVAQQQRAQAAATAAQDQAVQIMTTLANQYSAVRAAMPVTPAAAGPPVLTKDTTGATVIVTPTGVTYRINPNLGSVTVIPAANPQPAQVPLFGQMFSAGLASAAAALGGRFARAVSGFVHSGIDPGAVPVDAAAKAAASVGAGGFGGGAGLQMAASPLLTGSAAALGTTVGLAAGAAGAAGSFTGGFMPAMPFGGMMGAADGMNARRVPPWLVETEDVWGESSAVAPSVIGADPDPL
jgi:WXG100 family type VII secretion target